MKKFLTFASWILVVVQMAVILSLSGNTAEVSNEKSYAVAGAVEPAARLVAQASGKEPPSPPELNHIVRKAAHAVNYFLLALLICLAFRVLRLRMLPSLGLSFAASVFFAVLDEFFQTFVQGRSGEMRDVCIDGAGILCGLIFAALAAYIFGKAKKRKRRSIKY